MGNKKLKLVGIEKLSYAGRWLACCHGWWSETVDVMMTIFSAFTKTN